MVKIKICGLRSFRDIDYINAAAPDYAGLVFVADSRRFVTHKFAAEFVGGLRPGIIPVGVFANAQIDEIAELYCRGVIFAAQLHGGEDEIYISELGKKCADLTIIKAVSADVIPENYGEKASEDGNKISINRDKKINGNTDGIYADSGIKVKRGKADFLLIDSGKGGTGKTFDWRKIRGIEPPFFLAGGINLSNIDAALRLNPYAVDISGGAETDGEKDGEKIRLLTERVGRYNRNRL
ncbi:MAG: phosphoribosylanthranilate isomerase [Clostridiales bacterium]|jgi:phosphoribosylanthranilate isomerase|nr:phosphoribosylanthranilate isomerase [Clostridiales bacterium]